MLGSSRMHYLNGRADLAVVTLVHPVHAGCAKKHKKSSCRKRPTFWLALAFNENKASTTALFILTSTPTYTI